jgi:large subunit ribosomal protein L4
MASIEVKTKNGAAAGSVALSDKYFAAPVNKGLIFQAVYTQDQNSRQGTQSTKTRATVKHTTRKPYKQKGTGRARQGMLSGPHYRHGGVAMGPLPRLIVRDLPKKMRRAAVAGALSAKFAEGAVKAVDSLSFEQISTKSAASILKSLELTGKRVLIVLAAYDVVVYKSFRNIPNVEVRFATAFSTKDILAAQTIVFTQEALSKFSVGKEEA